MEEDISGGLLSDGRPVGYLNYRLPLYKAAMEGDWEAVRQIHSMNPECFEKKISKGGDTAVHIAAVANRTNFVVQLVRLIRQEGRTQLLALRNNMQNTALCLAAASGNVTIAREMVVANADLLRMEGNRYGLTPLHMAALLGRREMVKYLLNDAQQPLSNQQRSAIFIAMVNSDLYDIALGLLRQYPELAMARDDYPPAEEPPPPDQEEQRQKLPESLLDLLQQYLDWAMAWDDYPTAEEPPPPIQQEQRQQLPESPLHVLAKKCLTMPSKSSFCRCWNIFQICGEREEVAQQHKALELLERLWEVLSSRTQNEIETIIQEPWDVIFVATEMGNVEFVTTLLRSYPDLIWKLNDKGLSIFHVAVIHRQEKIFRLIYEIGSIKDLLVTYVDKKTKNTILHLAPIKPTSDRLNSISGAALRMQREMLWFKVVKDLVRPQYSEAKNENGKTPITLFTEEHKELREAGEEWMRKTAGSCSVVATLIASVVFTFILKVPRNESVVSLSDPQRYNAWYWVFGIFDSLSLITSTTSLLVFLTIMISRYAEKDFLYSLPQKLIIGLTLLFLSIISIALTTTFHILFKRGWPWFGIILLVFITIILFTQEFSLMWDIYSSTMKSTSTFQSPTPTLFEASSQQRRN